MSETMMEFIIILVFLSIPLILVISFLIWIVHENRSEKRFDDWLYVRYDDD